MSQQLGITAADTNRYSAESGPQQVIVMNVQMSIGQMCVFMIKWAIAAIPATIILFLIFTVMAALFGGIFRAIMMGR